nr:MAG: hypothetical protein [Bacteriophage sp.]
MNFIVTNPIIMILKAILNYFRLRRNYIANGIDKIPPELKKVLVAWYSPKKQKLNNYDVIESYAEDFTRLNCYENRGTINKTSNKIVITESKTNDLNIIENLNASTNDIVIKVTGVSEELKLFVRDINSVRQYISKDGVYKFTNNVYQFFGFGINKIISGINVVIEQLPTSILKDFSGNKHDAYLYGFKGKLNSGVGIYKIDFSKTLNLSAFDNFERLNNKVIAKGNYSGNWSVFGEYDINGIVKNKVTIKITGLNNIKERLSLEYGYYTTDSKYIKNIILIDKDGIYTYDLNDIIIPDESNISHTIYNRMYFGEQIINDINLIVEEIPDYSNQLCYDGKSYAVTYDMPILTDYTVIAERTWFERQNGACFLSKITTSGTGAFGFEFYNEYNEDTTYSFGRVNNVEQFKDGITYQITNSYNGIVKLDYIVNGKDNAELYIGKLRPSERPAFIGCHGAIIIADRSFTEEEINWLKQNWDKI